MNSADGEAEVPGRAHGSIWLLVFAGEQVGGLWVIPEGLKPGERVVTEGLQKVKDGIVVRPKPDTSAPAAPAAPGQG